MSTNGGTSDVELCTFFTFASRITVVDVAGHIRFVENFIGGSYRADVALLVISAVIVEFE